MPKDAEILIHRALDLEGDDLDSSITLLCRVTELYPNLEDGWFQYGRLLDRAERNEEAASAFQKAVEQNPKNPNYLVWLGDSKRKAGKHTEARRHLKEAIVLDPNRSDAFNCLAWSLLDTDQDDEALAVVDRGIQADGHVDIQDLPLFLQKVIILSRKNKWDEMVNTLQELDRAVPVADGEARAYVAGQLKATLRSVVEANRLDFASVLIDAIETFDSTSIPEGPDARAFRDHCLSRLVRSKLYLDASMPDIVKAIVQVWSGDDDSEESREFAKKIPLLLAVDVAARREEWGRALRKHPQAIEPLQAQWNASVGLAEQFARVRKRATSSGCGCTLLAALVTSTVAGTIGALLVQWVA